MRRTATIFAAMGLTLSVSAGALYFFGLRAVRAREAVVQQQRAIATLTELLSTLKDAETGQRGYLLAGEDAFLKPFEAALFALESNLKEIDALVAQNVLAAADAATLRRTSGDQMAMLRRGIDLRRTAGLDSAVAYIRTGASKQLMDQIRALDARMMDEESATLVSLRVRARRAEMYRTMIFVIILPFNLAFMAWCYRRLARERFNVVEQAERLRTTLASIGDGVISTDLRGQVSMMNGVAEALTGWKAADAIGLPLTVVFQIVGETTRREVENPALRALRDGAIVGLANHTVLIAKDGIERAIDDSAAPIRCAEGEMVRCVLVFRDVTEQRAAERVLRESQARNAAILEAGIDCIISMDHHGKIIGFNSAAQRTFGYSHEQAIGQPLSELLIPLRLRQGHADGLARYLATGEGPVIGRRIELQAQRADGNEFQCELSITRVPIDGPPIFTAHLRDITEQLIAAENLRRAKEEAEAANIAKDNFIATLSHELRTPLTPVLALLGSWEMLRAFPPELREDLEMIRRNVDLEARLIDDLLDLTRIVRGKIAMHLEVLDVQKLLDSVVTMYSSEIQNKKLDLRLVPRATGCFVRGDPGRLQQAFWNVLKNAVKFTPQGGSIEIATRNDADGKIQIIITDTGVGMGEEMLRRLFLPFEQETPGRYGGLGLGMAITKTLLEAQEGTIEATSAGPGRGTVFIITLPSVEAPTEGQAPERASDGGGEAAGEAPNRYRVLLVEDHHDTARVLARLLRGNGHEVTTAHSVAGGLAALRGQGFDVVVCDIGLPDGTGIDLIREVRQEHGLQMPAVALTGFGMEEDVSRTRAAGFNDHLTKPVNFVRLEETIQRACKRGA